MTDKDVRHAAGALDAGLSASEVMALRQELGGLSYQNLGGGYHNLVVATICRCNEILITVILENHGLTDNFTIAPKVLGDQELDYLDAAFCQTATEIPVTWTGIWQLGRRGSRAPTRLYKMILIILSVTLLLA